MNLYDLNVNDDGYGDEFASFYDKIFRHDENAEYMAKKLAELHPSPGQGTLELGVGTGRIALPLARRIGDVDAMDSSPEMLEVLRENKGEEPVHAIHGNFIDQLPDRRYGMVFAVCQTFSMIQSRRQQRRTLENVYSVLEPGGIFVIETGNPRYVSTLMQGQNPALTAVPLTEEHNWLITYSRIEKNSDNEPVWYCRQIFVDEQGEISTGIERSLLTAPSDIFLLAERVGFEKYRLLGDWKGNPFEKQSTPLHITVLQRPA